MIVHNKYEKRTVCMCHKNISYVNILSIDWIQIGIEKVKNNITDLLHRIM